MGGGGGGRASEKLNLRKNLIVEVLNRRERKGACQRVSATLKKSQDCSAVRGRLERKKGTLRRTWTTNFRKGGRRVHTQGGGKKADVYFNSLNHGVVDGVGLESGECNRKQYWGWALMNKMGESDRKGSMMGTPQFSRVFPLGKFLAVINSGRGKNKKGEGGEKRKRRQA